MLVDCLLLSSLNSQIFMWSKILFSFQHNCSQSVQQQHQHHCLWHWQSDRNFPIIFKTLSLSLALTNSANGMPKQWKPFESNEAWQMSYPKFISFYGTNDTPTPALTLRGSLYYKLCLHLDSINCCCLLCTVRHNIQFKWKLLLFELSPKS